jgi:hypothetical protein
MEKEQKRMRISVTFSGKSFWVLIQDDQLTFAELKELLKQRLIKSGFHLAGDFAIADAANVLLDTDPNEPIRTFLDDNSKVVLIPASDPIQEPSKSDTAASSTPAKTSEHTQYAVDPSSQPRVPQPMPCPKPTTIQSVEDDKQKLPSPLSVPAKFEAEQQQPDLHEEVKVVIKGTNSYFTSLCDAQREEIEKCIHFYSNACS